MRHKWLAGLIAFFLLYFSLTFLLMFLELKIISQPENLINIFNQAKIYQNINQVPEIIFGDLKTNEKMDLQTKILINSISQAVDAKDLQNQVEKNLPLFLNYLNGRGTLNGISFDLSNLKTGLKKVLPKVYLENLSDLPACPFGVIFSSQDSMQNLPDCLPDGSSPEQVTQSLLSSGTTDDFINQIPDKFNLGQIKNPEKVFAPALLAFRIINWSFWILLLLSLVFVGFLVYLGRNWWPEILRYVGWGLVLPSGTAVLLTFSSVYMIESLLKNQLAGVNQKIFELILPLVDALNRQSEAVFYLYGGAILGLGIILVILSYALPHPPEPKPESEETPKKTKPKILTQSVVSEPPTTPPPAPPPTRAMPFSHTPPGPPPMPSPPPAPSPTQPPQPSSPAQPKVPPSK